MLIQLRFQFTVTIQIKVALPQHQNQIGMATTLPRPQSHYKSSACRHLPQCMFCPPQSTSTNTKRCSKIGFVWGKNSSADIQSLSKSTLECHTQPNWRYMHGTLGEGCCSRGAIQGIANDMHNHAEGGKVVGVVALREEWKVERTQNFLLFFSARFLLAL